MSRIDRNSFGEWSYLFIQCRSCVSPYLASGHLQHRHLVHDVPFDLCLYPRRYVKKSAFQWPVFSMTHISVTTLPVPVQGLSEYSALENFWRRYNTALLDRTALALQKADLRSENQQLQKMLRDYLENLRAGTVTKAEGILPQVGGGGELLVVSG